VNTYQMEALQTAIDRGDIHLVKQAIDQGAQPKLLFIYAIRDIDSVDILALLLENGFNIHADANMIIRQWMGASESGSFRNNRPVKLDLLDFISGYCLEKPKEIEKFKSSILLKSLLFRIGLENNNLNIMKFAVLIGVNKNEALNAALNRYYAKNHGHSRKIDYAIIEFIVNANIEFTKDTITNAVCFKYSEVLDALSHMHDLEYGYEVAYRYENGTLLNYFTHRGVSKEAQSFAKMKVSASKGNIKELRKAVNEGANVKAIGTDVIVEVINKNRVEVLKYLHDAGLFLDTSLNMYLNEAMAHYKAYDAISYLIEQGLDITNVKNVPIDFKKRYPAIADMWEKRFSDIFEYTIYLAREVHPKVEGKEKEEVLKYIAALSTLPYVVKKSEEKSHA
jgi:hypothetical protein